MTTLFENSIITIYDLNAEIPDTLFIQWKDSFADEEKEMIDVFIATIHYVNELGAKIIIADRNLITDKNMHYVEWLDETYFKKCIDNGLKAKIIIDARYKTSDTSEEMAYNQQDFKSNKLFVKTVNNYKEAQSIAVSILGFAYELF